MNDPLALLAVVAAVALVAAVLRRRDGSVRPDAGTFAGTVGHRPGERLLVEFTAPGCSACGPAERVLQEVATGHDRVRVVTLDVTGHPDLAREHRVLRAPTTFVVDGNGAVLGRVTGVPSAGDLHGLLADTACAASR